MDKECFIIWSDDPARMEDLEEYKKYLAEECPELLEESDDELYLRLAEDNNNRLEDEKSILIFFWDTRFLPLPVLAVGMAV